MKPKHLFYGMAVVTVIAAVVCAVRGQLGMALLATVIASCSLLNATLPGANTAGSRNDVKRFFGIR